MEREGTRLSESKHLQNQDVNCGPEPDRTPTPARN